MRLKSHYTILLVCLILTCLGLFSIHGKSLFQLNTDLKSLAPQLSENKSLQAAINAFSGNIEKRFIVLIATNDEYDIYDVRSRYHQELLARAPLKSIDFAEWLDKHLLPQLKSSRFHLLTEDDRELLESNSEKALLETAKSRLYGLANIQFLSVSEDPFGFFNAWLSDLLEKIARGTEDDTHQVELDGETYYTQALMFEPLGVALDLNEQKSILSALEEVEKSIQVEYPQTRFYHSGVFFFSADAAEKSKRDISRISGFSALGLILVLGLAFASLRYLLLPFISIVFGASAAFILISALLGELHILTLIFGASLLGVVVDYALHFFYHFNTDAENQSANRSSLHNALLLSLCTSVIGYAALAFSTLPSLRQVAVFSAIGLSVACLSVLVFGPILHPKSRSQFVQLLPCLLGWLDWSLTKRQLKIIFFGLILFIAGFIPFFLLQPTTLTFLDNPRAIFEPSPALLEEETVVNQVLSDFEPGKYLLLEVKNEEDALTKLSQLYEEELVDLYEDSVSAYHFVPPYAQQAFNYQLQAKLYENQGAAKTLLSSLKANQGAINDLLGDYQHSETSALAPSVFTNTEVSPFLPFIVRGDHSLYASILIRKSGDIKKFKQAAAALSDLHFIDIAEASTSALHHQRTSSTVLLFLAYLFVGILLLARYREIQSLLLLSVPLVSSVLCLAILAFMGTPLSLFHIMALFLVLGLGMDYVIFIREMPLKSSATLIAVFLSALTSLLSFGLLALSEIPIVGAFGQTILLANFFNLVGAVLLRTWFKSTSEVTP